MNVYLLIISAYEHYQLFIFYIYLSIYKVFITLNYSLMVLLYPNNTIQIIMMAYSMKINKIITFIDIFYVIFITYWYFKHTICLIYWRCFVFLYDGRISLYLIMYDETYKNDNKVYFAYHLYYLYFFILLCTIDTLFYFIGNNVIKLITD